MNQIVFKSELANQVFNKITLLNATKTDDSNFTKFLNPQFIAIAHRFAAAFATMVYVPQMDPNETYRTKIYKLYLFLIVYGINIFLSEHSIETQGAPYSLKNSVEDVEKAQDIAFKKLTGKNKTTNAFDEVGSHIAKTVFASEFKNNMDFEKFKLQRKKAKEYLEHCLLYGYVLGREIIIV